MFHGILARGVGLPQLIGISCRLAGSGLKRQLVFMLATPVFICVFAWEYLKIRHAPQMVEGQRVAAPNFMLGQATRRPNCCLPAYRPSTSTRWPITIACWNTSQPLDRRAALGADADLRLLMHCTEKARIGCAVMGAHVTHHSSNRG